MGGNVGTAAVVTIVLAIILAAAVELLRVEATVPQASDFLTALGYFRITGLTQGLPLALGIAGAALLGRLAWGRWLGLLTVLVMIGVAVWTIVDRGFTLTPQAVVAYALLLITGFLLIQAKPHHATA